MNKILYLVIAVLAVVVVYQYNGAQHELRIAKIEYVQHLCDRAHTEISGASEVECGNAQDRTNTEYLCDKTGTTCWVEEK